MKAPTKEQVALGVTQFAVYMLVCLFGILPLLSDMDGWPWWKYLVFIVALMFVSRAVSETVSWTWEMVRHVASSWKKEK